MIVDNGHLVAWPEGMHYGLEKASAGWISSLTSGEGEGREPGVPLPRPGTVYIQSRNRTSIAERIKMSDTSIVNAKARLPSLVQRAEAGEPVHITRHGKRVAVILSERDLNRLTAAPPKRTGYLDFLADWRKRSQALGCEPLTDQEVASLRSKEILRGASVGEGAFPGSGFQTSS